jgi:hypothetical protein
MKENFMKQIYLISILFLLFTACKKKETPEPEPPAPLPAPTSGPISGKITHYDQYGVAHTSGLNNTTVSLEGKNIQATTNENGRYTLSDVPAGTHTMVISKPGTGLIKMQSIVYKIGDTISYNAAVADKPDFLITSAYVKDTTWFTTQVPGLYYKAVSTSTNVKASAVAIIGKTKDLTIADPSSYVNYAPASEVSKKDDYNRFMSYAFLRDTYGFIKKDTIYVKIYPVASEASGYIDGKLSKPVYTAYGQAHSTLFKLVMP